MRNLLRCDRGEAEQTTKGRIVLMGPHLFGNVELSDDVPPTQQLPTQRMAMVHLDREIHQTQYALVTVLESRRILGCHLLAAPVHFVADHEHLLVERELGPTSRRQSTVLGRQKNAPTRRRSCAVSILEVTMKMSAVSSVMSRFYSIAAHQASFAGLPSCPALTTAPTLCDSRTATIGSRTAVEGAGVVDCTRADAERVRAQGQPRANPAAAARITKSREAEVLMVYGIDVCPLRYAQAGRAADHHVSGMARESGPLSPWGRGLG